MPTTGFYTLSLHDALPICFVITDRNAFDSTRLGLEMGYALETLYPGKISWDDNRFLIGNRAAIEAGKNGETDYHPKDRKSTRLNSSHVAISYAVFCLKKKK